MDTKAHRTQAGPVPVPVFYASKAVLFSLLVVIFISACAQTGAAQSDDLGPAAPEACPVTFAPSPAFIPPPPVAEAPGAGQAWYGTPALWTVLPQNGVWEALPKSEDGYGQKLFFWSENYPQDEKQPEFEVVGKKFDRDLTVSGLDASNGGHNELGSFIVTGIELPEAGCWVITGKYQDQSLSYVVWVAGADEN